MRRPLMFLPISKPDRNQFLLHAEMLSEQSAYLTQPALRRRSCRSDSAGDGGFVAAAEVVVACQCSDQQQRRLRQVKIGDESIDRAERIGRMDVDFSFALPGFQLAGSGGRFQGSGGRGADGDHAATGLTSPFDSSNRLGRHVGPFAMYLMLARIVGAYRFEGAEADVQGHGGAVDSSILQSLQEFRREVQTRRRGGDGTGDHVEDGLIAFAVGTLGYSLANIGRQRHRADFLQQFDDRTGRRFEQRMLAAVTAINPPLRTGWVVLIRLNLPFTCPCVALANCQCERLSRVGDSPKHKAFCPSLKLGPRIDISTISGGFTLGSETSPRGYRFGFKAVENFKIAPNRLWTYLVLPDRVADQVYFSR